MRSSKMNMTGCFPGRSQPSAAWWMCGRAVQEAWRFIEIRQPMNQYKLKPAPKWRSGFSVFIVPEGAPQHFGMRVLVLMIAEKIG